MLKRIQEILSESKMTQGEFAAYIGINKASLSHVLSGRNKASLDFVLKLLKAFPQVDSQYLLFGGQKPEKSTPNAHQTVEQEGAAPTVNPESTNEIPSVMNTSGMKSGMPSADSDKEVEKIIILFRDGSFKMYKSQ